MSGVQTVPASQAKTTPVRLTKGAVAWSAFHAARDPYIVLILVYTFMPYVAAVMVGDPVRGQEAVAAYGQYSGWIVMLTAPFLGASIDRIGRRKPMLLAICAMMVPMIAVLWWAKPDQSGLSVGEVIALATIIGALFSYTEVFHNSLLVRAAGLSGAHKASGLGVSLGNVSSLAVLAFVAWAFALPGHVDWSFVPKAPLFGLDPASNEPDRIVAPIAALLLALGAIPLFLFTPDAKPTGVPIWAALREAPGTLWRMILSLRGYRDAAVFLVARMFYVDGMTATLLFAGVYARGVMQWGGLEMLFYGMSLTVMAVAGGFVGAALDQRVGPRRAVQIEIAMTILAVVALLGMARDRILFFWSYDTLQAPLWNGPMFRTLPEIIFIGIGLVSAIFITAHYASSRTLLTRLTPPEQTGAFFGVYALSGTATVWLGSFLVNMGTQIFETQQGGFAMVTVLLGIGFIGLMFVRGGDPPATA